MAHFDRVSKRFVSSSDSTAFDQGPAGGPGGVPVDVAIPPSASVTAFQVAPGVDGGELHIHQVTLFFDDGGSESSITRGTGGTLQTRVNLQPNQHIRTIIG